MSDFKKYKDRALLFETSKGPKTVFLWDKEDAPLIRSYEGCAGVKTNFLGPLLSGIYKEVNKLHILPRGGSDTFIDKIRGMISVDSDDSGFFPAGTVGMVTPTKIIYVSGITRVLTENYEKSPDNGELWVDIKFDAYFRGNGDLITFLGSNIFPRIPEKVGGRIKIGNSGYSESLIKEFIRWEISSFIEESFYSEEELLVDQLLKL